MEILNIERTSVPETTFIGEHIPHTDRVRTPNELREMSRRLAAEMARQLNVEADGRVVHKDGSQTPPNRFLRISTSECVAISQGQ